MTNLTESEKRLAKIYAQQLLQYKLGEAFVSSFESEDNKTVSDLIEIAGSEWSRKVEKIQVKCRTNNAARQVLTEKVLSIM